MPTENSAVHPMEKSSGSFMALTAAPQSKALPDSAVTDGGSAAGVASQTQTYMDRVRNYVPVEVIGFFIFVNAMVAQDTNDPSSKMANDFVAIASIVVSLVAVFVIARMANAKAKTETWVVQASVSACAFLVWAYAVGAQAVSVLDITQEPVIAAFLLATFSLFSGLIVPVKRKSPAPTA